uniref:Uncharacterized protein LOC104247792 n=1 Tax=Nicotiana sylvestris TaxID=4096 RepID=A0A1U7YDJ6_NICSY|nr:PREDICTED: uncharacterized protein LOC104247792 [Nicotiana sylvestris]
MDALTHHIQGEVPWCMLFADDIVLIDEMRGGFNERLKVWRRTLESKGFKLSSTNSEYMDFKFSSVPGEADVDVRLDSQVIPKKGIFKYMRSTIQGVPPEPKGKFYRTVVRPAMLYGTEWWPVKVGLAPMEDKMREATLRWFRNVKRRSLDAPTQVSSQQDKEMSSPKQSSPSQEKMDEKGVHSPKNAAKSTVSNNDTASPVQTVTSKDTSNPFMTDCHFAKK